MKFYQLINVIKGKTGVGIYLGYSVSLEKLTETPIILLSPTLELNELS